MQLNKSTLIAGLFGNALEWYDFILFANFAPIIAALFFPTKDPAISLILTFVVFATGFLVRPLGALIFGYIGDHVGRRTALIISMLVITVPTALVGFIPSYATIGIAAPILLAALRILQGIAISGELSSATTFLVESVAPNRRGLAGCLVMGTAFLGILFGALTTFLMTLFMSLDALHQWGWRAPFWLGGVLGLIGLMMRLRTKESPKYLQQTFEVQKPNVLKRVVAKYWRKLLLSIVLTSVMAVSNYVFVAFMVTFLTKYQGFSLKDATFINLISMFIMVLLFPLAGLLSDKIGRKPVFKAGLWGMVLFSIPAFVLLSEKIFWATLVGDILLGLLIVPLAATIPTMLAELFPLSVRNTGSALGYNIALALFGGTAPLVALSLINFAHTNLAPAYYLIGCTVLSAIALCFVHESHDKPLL
jgi:proline/betaine transport protein TphA